jgi:SAM-dependent methyltransferase
MSLETERVREDWSRRGKHWDKRADEVAPLADRFNMPLIEAADIREGQKVVDLATGAGEPMLTVAALIGAAGSVYATDLVPEMLEGARRRTATEGLSNVSFRVADMCDLPDADATFDRAICRFGLMFVDRPVRATREAFRVLKPGGRVAYLVWGPRADTTMFEVFAEAANDVWGPDDPLIDLQTMCSLGEEGAMRNVLTEAGFGDVEERELKFSPKVPAGREFWHAQIDMSFGPKMDVASEEEQQAVKRAIAEKFNRYIKDGEYHMNAHVRIGVGTKT